VEPAYSEAQTVGAMIVAILPLPYLAASLLVRRQREHADWRAASVAAALALCASMVAVLFAATVGDGDVRLRATVMLLVAFVAVIIVRFSRTYLAGEPNQARYLFALMATLGAVAVVVTTNNLLVLALAWTGASLALHSLLTFYPERRAALIAAHKKFIVSRAADACLFAAVLLLAHTLDTLQIDELLKRATMPELPSGARFAVVLIAVTALLRCAQLPFHGWLIQVMEAPTPVSALLHAGVVNLGGFVIIRLGPLVAAVEVAQIILVGVGAVTAAVAALVAMTRISIKVALAWSTCAQMGFMLMQCGFGAYDLALLHLLAHSLYKAHEFLSSGSVVDQARVRLMSPDGPSVSAQRSTLAAIAVFSVAGLGATWFAAFGEPAAWAPAVVVCLAVAHWLALPIPKGYRARAAAVGGAVVTCWIGLHVGLGAWIQAPFTTESVSSNVIAVTIVWFAALYALQATLVAWPAGTLARSLYPLFYAGFYLDELLTRATFRIWPVRARAVVGHHPSLAIGDTK